MNQLPPPSGDREQFEADLRTLHPTGSIDPLRLWQQHEQAHTSHAQVKPEHTTLPQPARVRFKRFAAHAITASLSAAATLLLTTNLPTGKPSPERALVDRAANIPSASPRAQPPAQQQPQLQPAPQKPLTTITPAPVDSAQESTISLDTWLNLAMRIPPENVTSSMNPGPQATQPEAAKQASIGGPAQSPSTWRQLALELRKEIIDPAL